MKPLSRMIGPSARQWYAIKAQSSKDAEVLIYDYIGLFGVEAAAFAKDLQQITAKTIHVRINSPGGDVFDGLAIYNALKAHGATIRVTIDGIAASIASIVAMAGDSITMGESGFLMVHNPWALAIGNASDMRKMAEVLDKIGDSLAGIYASRTKKTTDEAKKWMDDETWFNAEEAKAAGLVDAIHQPDESAAAAAMTHFDFSGYTKTPTALQDTMKAEQPDPAHEGRRRTALMRRRAELAQRGAMSR